MWIKNSITLVCLVVIFTSCVDEFWPNVDKYERLLVVDGLLTNGDDPVKVSLSLTSSINDIEFIPLVGAEVYITDENQGETSLTETESGTYLVLDSSFSGHIGNSYQLHVVLPDGRNYISDTCRLLPPSPIDSVYGLPESFNIENVNNDLHGVQFYVDFHNDLPEKYFHLWKLTQTYKYKSSFNIDFLWIGEIIPYPNPDSLRSCWRTSQVNDIFIFSSKYLDGNDITRFPLVYTSTKTKKLSIRYSLHVDQLSISENAFDFWNALKEQNLDQGNLYSHQPIQIRGNMHNVQDPNESVLGYFTVAGITKKRIYVNRPAVIPFYYDICQPDFEAYSYIAWEPPTNWPIYIVDIMFLGGALGQSNSCFDCRLEGGSITPPDFWED